MINNTIWTGKDTYFWRKKCYTYTKTFTKIAKVRYYEPFFVVYLTKCFSVEFFKRNFHFFLNYFSHTKHYYMELYDNYAVFSVVK